MSGLRIVAGVGVLMNLIATVASAQQVGPSRGALVVVGGALKDMAIVERFLALAGGADQPIVIVPSAGASEEYDEYWDGLELFERAGATRLTVLHTRDRQEADTEAFVAPLRTARGVWFSGGRQWRLTDSYLHTKAHAAFDDVLARGGVIGGSSAGASVQASFLVRGDTGSNTIMMGDHVEGLGFLKNVAIDQHLLRRNRQFDLIEVVRAHPDLLGIGIDEDTAIVVEGDRFEVMGQGYVAIYDHGRQLDSGGLFYLLAPGDVFDMATREAYRPRTVETPVERVEKRPWPQP